MIVSSAHIRQKTIGAKLVVGIVFLRVEWNTANGRHHFEITTWTSKSGRWTIMILWGKIVFMCTKLAIDFPSSFRFNSIDNWQYRPKWKTCLNLWSFRLILDYKLTFLVSLYLPKHTGSETGSKHTDLMGCAILDVECVISVRQQE